MRFKDFMKKDHQLSFFERFILNAEFKLILLLSYIIALFSIGIRDFSLWSMISIHFLFVFLLSLLYFGKKFLCLFFFPFILIFVFIQNIISNKGIKNFKKSIPTEAVIILGQTDFFKTRGWFNLNFLGCDIKILVKYLKKKGQDFSFYPNASREDVEKIMENKNIKEVFFVGHGDSHIFELKTGEFLYYCDFNDSTKYGKDFVHQVHCGTPQGKCLIDYVVPEKNRNKCFFFRKPINSFKIEKEFKKRIKEIL